jgi:hypothetical protein
LFDVLESANREGHKKPGFKGNLIAKFFAVSTSPQATGASGQALIVTARCSAGGNTSDLISTHSFVSFFPKFAQLLPLSSQHALPELTASDNTEGHSSPNVQSEGTETRKGDRDSSRPSS